MHTNDGSGSEPRLRLDLNLGNAWLLPSWSTGPGPDDDVYARIADAGYDGVQGGDPVEARRTGLRSTAFGVFRRIDEPLLDWVTLWRDMGNDAATLHVGTGLESDDEALALMDAVLAASEQTGLPLFVETHRATVTQDLWRTVQWANARPSLRFNGDFSHWYTGLEMPYGDLEAKLAFIAPVVERTAYVHGRIGDSGCIQVDLGPEGDHPSVPTFERLWADAMHAFRVTAQPGDVFVFAPELLPASIGYARWVTTHDGKEEEGDRWEQALVLSRIARRCWDRPAP